MEFGECYVVLGVGDGELTTPQATRPLRGTRATRSTRRLGGCRCYWRGWARHGDASEQVCPPSGLSDAIRSVC